MKSQERKKVVLFWVLWLFKIFTIFLKCARVYRPFCSFSLLWNLLQLYFSIFFFRKTEKLNILAIYKSIIIIFLWIFLWYLYKSFVRKKSISITRKTSRTLSRWSSTRKGRNQNLISYYSFFKSFFGVYLQVAFWQFQNQPLRTSRTSSRRSSTRKVEIQI